MPRPKRSPHIVAEWARLYEAEGLSAEAIGPRYSVHGGTVLYNLHTAGVRIRKQLVAGGARRNQIHNIWTHMRDRCRNPANSDYKDYGARGIAPCTGWEWFADFAADVGDRPSPAYSLDRIDPNGGYWCGRCLECVAMGRNGNWRWATAEVQQRNKRTSWKVSLGGETLSVPEWAERTGLPPHVIRLRLRLGWDAARAVTQPMRPGGSRVGRNLWKDKLSTTRIKFIERCTKPACRQFPDYGGRGITVCHRWLTSHASFVADVGFPPTLAHTLDRIDNAGGYWCGQTQCKDCAPAVRVPNCRWATRVEQAANRRPCRKPQYIRERLVT